MVAIYVSWDTHGHGRSAGVEAEKLSWDGSAELGRIGWVGTDRLSWDGSAELGAGQLRVRSADYGADRVSWGGSTMLGQVSWLSSHLRYTKSSLDRNINWFCLRLSWRCSVNRLVYKCVYAMTCVTASRDWCGRTGAVPGVPMARLIYAAVFVPNVKTGAATSYRAMVMRRSHHSSPRYMCIPNNKSRHFSMYGVNVKCGIILVLGTCATEQSVSSPSILFTSKSIEWSDSKAYFGPCDGRTSAFSCTSSCSVCIFKSLESRLFRILCCSDYASQSSSVCVCCVPVQTLASCAAAACVGRDLMATVASHNAPDSVMYTRFKTTDV